MGIALASREALATSLLAIFESHEYTDGAEELLLNACCALTNLSFYNTPDNKVGAMGGGPEGGQSSKVLGPHTQGGRESGSEHDLRLPCFLAQLLALMPARLLRHVTPLLLCDNEEAVVEAARAFGNFSRAAEARQYLITARVLEALVLLLDHSSAEVLCRWVRGLCTKTHTPRSKVCTCFTKPGQASRI